MDQIIFYIGGFTVVALGFLLLSGLTGVILCIPGWLINVAQRRIGPVRRFCDDARGYYLYKKKIERINAWIRACHKLDDDLDRYI